MGKNRIERGRREKKTIVHPVTEARNTVFGWTDYQLAYVF